MLEHVLGSSLSHANPHGTPSSGQKPSHYAPEVQAGRCRTGGSDRGLPGGEGVPGRTSGCCTAAPSGGVVATASAITGPAGRKSLSATASRSTRCSSILWLHRCRGSRRSRGRCRSPHQGCGNGRKLRGQRQESDSIASLRGETIAGWVVPPAERRFIAISYGWKVSPIGPESSRAPMSASGLFR